MGRNKQPLTDFFFFFRSSASELSNADSWTVNVMSGFKTMRKTGSGTSPAPKFLLHMTQFDVDLIFVLFLLGFSFYAMS